MGIDTLGMRAVFLDRDGVINRAPVKDGRPDSPSRVEEVEILPGVPEGLLDLKKEGFLLVVVTNQPDVARGTRSLKSVEEINRFLRNRLPLDDIRVCYHDDRDHCLCRKPLPGLLLEAAKEHAIELPRSFMVGDRWRDMEAGERAGCRTIFMDYGYGEKRPARYDHRVETFRDAAEWIRMNKDAIP